MSTRRVLVKKHCSEYTWKRLGHVMRVWLALALRNCVVRFRGLQARADREDAQDRGAMGRGMRAFKACRLMALRRVRLVASILLGM
jgi:hypothetical protein